MSNEIKAADIKVRAFAAIIDITIAGVLLTITMKCIAMGSITGIIIFSLAAACYIVFQDCMFDRQSVGKKIMGLQCYNIVNMRVANFKETLIRGTLRLFMILSVCAIIVDIFASFVDIDKRRFCDMAAGTIIINMPKA